MKTPPQEGWIFRRMLAPFAMDQLLPVEAVLAALHWRYATKKFDPVRKLTVGEWSKLEEALLLSASSYGMQPYRFINVTDVALKEQLLPAAYGQNQITECSHLVVFAARVDVTADDVNHYMERISEVRGVDREKLAGFEKVILGDVVNGPRHAVITEWCARQAYIALGNLMTVAALTAVDICPIEGFDTGKFDEILGLREKGLASKVLAAVGHRAHDDGAASLPKVRMPAQELIEHR